MDDMLMRYARGQVPVPKADRDLAAQARYIVNETRLAALKVDGICALAAHIMDDMMRLDDYRKSISTGDPTTDAMLEHIEGTALQCVLRIQRQLFTGW